MKKVIFGCILFLLLGVQFVCALEPALEDKIQTLVQKLSLEKSKKLEKLLEKKIEAIAQKNDEVSFSRYDIYSYILGQIKIKILTSDTVSIKQIFENIFTGFVQKNTDAVAKVSVIVYDDLECPYCAKLHNDGTLKKVRDTYGNDVQIIFQHYPLSFHEDAFPAAALLECIGSKKGTSGFYDAIDAIFTSKDPSKENIVKIGGKLGVQKEDLDVQTCTKLYGQKIQDQMNVGVHIFQIQGTPSSVIVDNSTYKYEVISGAVPFEYFKKSIDTFLSIKKESY